MNKLLIILLFSTILFATKQPEIYDTNDINILFDAIIMVESSGGKNVVGDDGKSLGPYQIQYNYWYDAVEFNSEFDGTKYEDVFDKEYSERIMLSYWKRYSPKHSTFEILSRIHNGGPSGYKRKSTHIYWKKVNHFIKREE
jgi:hypothetical protein